MVDDEPHAYEHSIETQLPFLLRCLGPGIRVLPVLVGAAPPAAVAALLSTVACDPGVLTVVSTDLSHYLSRAQAQERDARTAAGVLAKDGDVLQPKDACGYHPLQGLLQFAAERDLTVQLLQLATSADAGGDPAGSSGTAPSCSTSPRSSRPPGRTAQPPRDAPRRE